MFAHRLNLKVMRYRSLGGSLWLPRTGKGIKYSSLFSKAAIFVPISGTVLSSKGNMRFKMKLELCGKKIGIDYRRKILHLVKTGMSKYSEETFKKFFSDGVVKEYTWTCLFRNASFTKNEIVLKDGKAYATVDFSFFNYEDGIEVYNSILFLKKKKISITFSESVKATVQGISFVRENDAIRETETFKILSPVICRDHDRKTFGNTFLKFSEKNFAETLKRNLLLKIEKNSCLKRNFFGRSNFHEILEEDIKNLELSFPECRNIVVKHYCNKNGEKGAFMNAALGKVRISGKEYLTEYIYKAGLGSMTGNGFGMLEIDAGGDENAD